MLMRLSRWVVCGAMFVLPCVTGGCVLEQDMVGSSNYITVEDAATVQDLDGCYLVTEVQRTDFYFDGVISDTHTVKPEDYSTRFVTIRRFGSQQVLHRASLPTPFIPAPLPVPSWWTVDQRRHHHIFREGYRGARQWSETRVKMVAVKPGDPDSDQAIASDADYWRTVIATHVPKSNPLREELRVICERQMARVAKANPDNGRYKRILMDLNMQAP